MPTLTLERGVSRSKGERPHQQDQYSFVDNAFESTGYGLYMVFDGHGSEKYAIHASRRMPHLILESREFQERNFRDALVKSFFQEDSELKEGIFPGSPRGGTTATIALIAENCLYVANVGDSRAVIGEKIGADKDYNAIRVCVEDKPSLPSELKRLKRIGAKVRGERVVNRLHSINMTRALGDFDFKKPFTKASDDVISPAPHLTEFKLTSSDQFLVLASDGLWNVLEDDQVVEEILNMREEGKTPQEIADALTSELGQMEGADNITIILVVFNWKEE